MKLAPDRRYLRDIAGSRIKSHVQLRHYFKQYVCCHHRLQALMFLEAFLQRGEFLFFLIQEDFKNPALR